MRLAIWVGSYLLLQGCVIGLTEFCILHSGFRRQAGRRICRTVCRTLFALALIMPLMGAFLKDGRVKFFLQAAGNIGMGFLMYYGGLLLAFTIILLIVNKAARKAFRFGGLILASAAISLVLNLYGLSHAQKTVVKTYEITLDKPLSDTRIVFVSDLHLSVNSNLPLIERIVKLINEQEADLVLVGGDVFTSSYQALKDPQAYAETLRGIRSREGVFAVFGNHDVEETLLCGFAVSPPSKAFRSPEITAFFEDSGFRILEDEMAEICGLQLFGRKDLEKAGDGTRDHLSPEALLEKADRAKPVLVLEHEPVEYRALSENGADLIISGHTHNGQIFPGNLLVRLMAENAYGHKTLYETDTLVSSGVGYYGPPLRIGTNSEIMVINVKGNQDNEQK
ncbi:MAG: metallophosphoesterase [Lachnospiraceae bacterium]|nr:metallophosphoesterase [Lachnospiraceae bacterium]